MYGILSLCSWLIDCCRRQGGKILRAKGSECMKRNSVLWIQHGSYTYELVAIETGLQDLCTPNPDQMLSLNSCQL